MDLGFAIGVVSSKYSELLEKINFNNLKDTPKDKFIETLNDYNYGIKTSNDFETIMLEAELKHKMFLESIIDSNSILFKVLYRNFDHIFLANLIKSYHLKLPYQSFIKGLSTFNEKVLEDYVLLSVDTTIDIELKGFIDNIINITKDLDAKSISDIVIKELNNSIYENINKMDQALKWFYTLDTTIENILLFIRSKRFDQDLKYVETNYLKGSKIDFDYIKEYYLDVFDNLGKYLALHFNEEVIKVVKGFKDDISLNQLTDYFTSYFDNDINPYNFSYDTFGPVIDLTMKKRNEIVKLKKLFYGIGDL